MRLSDERGIINQRSCKANGRNETTRAKRGLIKIEMEVAEMTSKENLVGNDVLMKSFAHMTYSSLYTSDLQESCKWYDKAFGFQIVSINSDFATMEFAPGRIVFFNRNPDHPRKISFSTRNIKALRRQLILADVEIEVDEESYLKIKDIDGNTIEVSKMDFEYDCLSISTPSQFVRDLFRCRLETKDEMYLIAKQIADDIEFHAASAKLLSLCQQQGLIIEEEAFIASRYSDKKVEAIFACIAVANPPEGQLPDGMKYIHIPRHDYTIFPIPYDLIDQLRTWQYFYRSDFMHYSFTKPEEGYYILEYFKDDFIHAYMPYITGIKVGRSMIRRKIIRGRKTMMSKQYLEMSISTLYSSDIQASAKWYYNIFGFQLLDMNSNSAKMQVAPGVIFYLSTNEDSGRRLDLSTKRIEDLRSIIAANHIEIEEEHGTHWIAFRDPDNNIVGAWAGGFGMELIETTIPDVVDHDIIRFYLIAKDETHLIATKISDQDDFANASAELSLFCKEQGLTTLGEAMTASKYAQQVDAVYVCIPIAEQPLGQMPSSIEIIRIPAQDYSVYPIHKSKVDDLRSNQIPNRVKFLENALRRPESFYVLESYKDEEYIQAYIPYV